MLISDKQAENALDAALEKIGSPYQWGGNGPDAFDCSGLIVYSYQKALGKDKIFKIGEMTVADVAMDHLYNYNVQLLPLEKVKTGDIIFLTDSDERITHGGLFIEWVDDSFQEFKFIHASSYYGKVLVDTWAIDDNYSSQWFVGAGRLKLVY
ncbi:MAG: C40 family peptidase [Halothermotrichaceae bacterium]